jgi:hypothetical protein
MRIREKNLFICDAMQQINFENVDEVLHFASWCRASALESFGIAATKRVL